MKITIAGTHQDEGREVSVSMSSDNVTIEVADEMTENRAAALEALNSCLAMDGDDGAGYLWDMMSGEHLATIRSALQSQPPMVGELVDIIKDLMGDIGCYCLNGYEDLSRNPCGFCKGKQALEKYKEQRK